MVFMFELSVVWAEHANKVDVQINTKIKHMLFI